MGPVRQNPIQRTVSLFICVSIELCTIVAHNIAQNRPDSFPPYPPDNHHCSDDVYLREGGPSWQILNTISAIFKFTFLMAKTCFTGKPITFTDSGVKKKGTWHVRHTFLQEEFVTFRENV